MATVNYTNLIDRAAAAIDTSWHYSWHWRKPNGFTDWHKVVENAETEIEHALCKLQKCRAIVREIKEGNYLND